MALSLCGRLVGSHPVRRLVVVRLLSCRVALSLFGRLVAGRLYRRRVAIGRFGHLVSRYPVRRLMASSLFRLLAAFRLFRCPKASCSFPRQRAGAPDEMLRG
ncbi:hypothetical protein Ait01nite_101230 [Actinoplanes italicus]|nr:hypothetical protein Ait01nite_101230 [Actinoplanes italicus]